MELLQLKYFLALAETEHLTRVAETMFVSPSAVSSSLSRLEEDLGVKLFLRKGRNIRLSPYGKSFYVHVQKAFQELEDGIQEIKDMSSTSDTQINIATTDPYVWRRPIQQFSRIHPEISFNHITFDPIAFGSHVPKDPVDLIIASPEAFTDPGWNSEPLFSDKIALAVPVGHPFADRKSISLIEAKDESFVALPDSSFSRTCRKLCLNAGFTPKVRITCDYMLRPNMVRQENMVCLTTYHGKSSGVFTDIPLIPLEDKGAYRIQSIFWKKDRYLSTSARLFKEYMKELYSTYQPEDDRFPVIPEINQSDT